MRVFIKNLGGNRALKYRVAFLILATFITSGLLRNVKPQVIEIAKPVVNTIVYTTESTTLPTTLPETTTTVAPYISMSLTSVQNDIRIKFYDRNKKLYTGYEVQLIITYPDGTQKPYSDENMDGKINIKDLAAGKYHVEMVLPDLFECSNKEKDVAVKDKVEYKPIVDIKEDVQKEDPKKETAKVPVVEEEVLNDTVELFESTKTAYFVYVRVEASQVAVSTTLTTTNESSNTSTSATASVTGESSTEATDTSTTTNANDPLLDKDNNQLYIKDGAEYKMATQADFNSNGEYYKKVQKYSYTGWQTIDGKRYYYVKDSTGECKPVTGNQIINKTKYSFDATGVLQANSGILGIDVSRWQGENIDWNAVKNSGVQFVILRCGGRYYGGGGLYNDMYFDSYIRGAKAAGLKVGVYFFSAAINEAEAVEEASAAVAVLKGAKLQYPVFIDIEYGNSSHTGRADGNSKSTWTAIAKAFCETVKAAGYKPGIYADKNHMENLLDMAVLSKYTIWLAQYNKEVTYRGKYDIWQYTSSGSVYGIKGEVDMNLSYIY